MTLYEGMFLIDNDTVRAGWREAKAAVTGVLEKHGAEVRTARRWDERRLAYQIRRRRRATYLLAYFEADGAKLPAMAREIEMKEDVLRHLTLRVEEVPEGEVELSEAELAEGFTVPEPPPEEAADLPAEEEREPEEARAEKEGPSEDEDEGADEESSEDEERGSEEEREG